MNSPRPVWPAVTLLIVLSLLAGCGKKGAPLPPLATRPLPAADLEAWQEGARIVLRADYPDSTVAGIALESISAIEIWRRESTDEVQIEPGTMAPRAKRIAVLAGDALAGATRGGQLVWSDLLTDASLNPEKPRRRLVYQLVVATDEGFSEPSDAATVVPLVLAYAPEIVQVSVSEDGVRLVLSPRDASAGALVFRRSPGQPQALDPVATLVDPEIVLLDRGVPDGCWLYRAAALLDESGARGPRGQEIQVEVTDMFPPPTPGPAEVFREESRVLLLWEPVAATDLAGYRLEKSLECWQPWQLAEDLIETTTWNGALLPEDRVCYRLLSVDTSGNSSLPSPEFEAPPF